MEVESCLLRDLQGYIYKSQKGDYCNFDEKLS